jgi:hypothetical protein
MPNIGAHAQKQMLDWVLGGAGATAPSGGRWVGLAWGTPTYTGGSELNTSIGYSRLTGSFGAANSPAGSASNNVAMTFGPFSSIMSILGIHVWDGSPVASSNMWLYGTLQTARTVGVGDSLVVAAGALIVTLS